MKSVRIHVLHVDDEPDFAELAAKFLQRESRSIEVETAHEAEAGLSKLQQYGIDCVVSDYDMPGTDGIEFLRQVRRMKGELPFILFTGKGSEEIAGEAISAGVTDYLQKETGTSQYGILANRITNAVERRRAREQASQTQEQLRLLAENTEDILWMYTADWEELVFINSAYEEIWGRPIEELREFPPAFQRGVHPEDRSITREAMDDLSSGESIDIEFRVNAEEQFGRWVWVKGYPVFEQDGTVSRVTGFARGITDRKARERLLQRESERLDALFKNSRDPVAFTEIVDSEPVVREVNQAFQETFGYPREEIVGKPIDAVVAANDETMLNEARSLNDRIESGERIEVEVRRSTASGTRDFLLKSIPFELDENGRFSFTIYTDITEQKQRERELRRYYSIINSIGDPVYVLDDEACYSFVNDAFVAETGYDRTAIIGEHVSKVVPEEYRDRGEDLIRELLDERQRSTATWELERKTAGDEPIPVENRMTVLTGDDGFEGTVGVLRDISDRVRHERQLERQLSQFEHFGSVLSHDLRTPIETLRGRLELAKASGDPEHLEKANSALVRVDQLVTDLAEVMKEGELVKEETAVSLEECATSVWDSLRSGSASLEISSDRRIFADRDALTRLLENLLKNSIEHGSEGGAVTVGALEDGFYIEDDGPGIPGEIEDEVFTAGFSTKEGGAGMGLASANQIAVAHGWRMTVEPGETGARLEITDVDLLD